MLGLPQQDDGLDRATQRRVERVLAELRGGAPVVVAGGEGQAALVLAAEAVTDDAKAGLAALSNCPTLLLITVFALARAR